MATPPMDAPKPVPSTNPVVNTTGDKPADIDVRSEPPSSIEPTEIAQPHNESGLTGENVKFLLDRRVVHIPLDFDARLKTILSRTSADSQQQIKAIEEINELIAYFTTDAVVGVEGVKNA